MKRMCRGHNLGSIPRRLHLRLSVMASTFTLGLGLVLAERGLAAHWGVLLAIPLTLASYWLLAGLFGVCTLTGVRGGRVADHGYERIADREMLKQLRLRGLMLFGASLAMSAVGTGVFMSSVG
jgi:hypothetical protein